MNRIRSPRRGLPAALNRVAAVTALFLATASMAAPPAAAGTLCGTVRDALTSGPVARAGIFLRNLDWTYTGLHAASAADGTWCLDAVPAGTYQAFSRASHFAPRDLASSSRP